MRTLAIPSDSAIAVRNQQQRDKDKEEQQQLKRLVLENERRQAVSGL